jgi:kumamolisin
MQKVAVSNFKKRMPSQSRNLAGSARTENPEASYHGKVKGAMPIELTLALRGPPLPDFDGKPLSGLSQKQLNDKFGASKADAKLVSKVMREFGFDIQNVNVAARSIAIKGTVAQAMKAFEPTLAMYKNEDQGVFRDRTGGYHVPVELEGIVSAVIGLSQRRIIRPKRVVKDQNRLADILPAATPDDIEKIYDFPKGTAAGQKIAIAEFGGGYIASDLKAYCKKFGRTVPDVRAISVNAPAYTWSQMKKLPRSTRKDELSCTDEVMLDSEIIAGLCPRAKINIYFATFDQKGFVDLLNRVIADRPVVLSISWAVTEDASDWSGAARTAINERLALAAASGITVCAAAGDDGAGDGRRGKIARVGFPASSPYVLGVGGTQIGGNNGNLEEVTWWFTPGTRSGGGASTGGGVSSIFDRPKWQNVRIKSGNRGAKNGRVVPDVAALAEGPRYSYVLFGKNERGAGTSASAPVWAALIARVNQKLPKAKKQRFLTPLLYRKLVNGKTLGSAVCHDITVGNNRTEPPGFGYSAKQGYDAVTGWGSPNGNALLKKLQSLK